MLSSILRMRHKVTINKNHTALLESIKVYAKRQKVDKVLLSKTQLDDLMKSRTVDEYRDKFIKKFKLVDKLNLSSRAFKAKLCSHARYFAHANLLAKKLNRDKLMLIYAKKSTAKISKKFLKSLAKKSTAKKI